jgi:hypothetical protein
MRGRCSIVLSPMNNRAEAVGAPLSPAAVGSGAQIWISVTELQVLAHGEKKISHSSSEAHINLLSRPVKRALRNCANVPSWTRSCGRLVVRAHDSMPFRECWTCENDLSVPYRDC